MSLLVLVTDSILSNIKTCSIHLPIHLFQDILAWGSEILQVKQLQASLCELCLRSSWVNTWELNDSCVRYMFNFSRNWQTVLQSGGVILQISSTMQDCSTAAPQLLHALWTWHGHYFYYYYFSNLRSDIVAFRCRVNFVPMVIIMYIFRCNLLPSIYPFGYSTYLNILLIFFIVLLLDLKSY